MLPQCSDLPRVIFVFLAALFQTTTVAFSELTGLGVPNDIRSDQAQHLLVPAGYAFAIWGLIYLAAWAFVIWQALPRNHASPLLRSISWLAGAAYCINGFFQVWVPLMGLDWISIVLVWVELILCLFILRHLQNARALSWLQLGLVSFPFGLLTGWLLAAGFVGIGSAALWQPIVPLDPNTLAVAIPLAGLAILVAAIALRTMASWAMCFGTCWGYWGIYAANSERGEPVVIGIIALTGIAVLAAVQITNAVQRRTIA